MEEKLDKIIELLEIQNKIMNMLIAKPLNQHMSTSNVGPSFGNMPGPSNIPSSNSFNVKQMIEEARAKAISQIENMERYNPKEEKEDGKNNK